MMTSLKECFSTDEADINGYSRSELVDKAYGTGHMHDTLWNIDRKVVRTSCNRNKLVTRLRESNVRFNKAPGILEKKNIIPNVITSSVFRSVSSAIFFL